MVSPPAGPGAKIGFSEHLIKSGYSYSYGRAAADLDGDGDLDLAVAGFVSNDVTILRNR